VEAARQIVSCLHDLTPDDLVVFLISGGGSALLVAPPAGITLAEKQALTQALLRSGVTIEEMNCVRKHLSTVEGGRLARLAAPVQMVTLAISDIPGDDLSAIASGPSVPDPTTREDALAILRHHRIPISDGIARWLASTACETPKSGDPAFARASATVIASPIASLCAAAAHARASGLPTIILSDAIEGEAREAGA
jgi:hydroxypyruvate reductase